MAGYSLDITDKQFCILIELHQRKSVVNSQCTQSERMSLVNLQKKSMVYRNRHKWTITQKGANASNRYMQLHEA